jgi:hypothetical protein
VTRRLTVKWPDPGPFATRSPGEAIRILAISDDPDPTLEHEVNRRQLGRVDVVVGAGDLEPDYLSFVADAFVAPLVYVRGNHDAGGAWLHGTSDHLPEPLPDAAIREDAGLPFVGLSWPRLGVRGRPPADAAWFQVLPLLARSVVRPTSPLIVVSHVPPRGAGDAPNDPFHTGFSAYRQVADRLRPPLWLHGHTHLGSAEAWHGTIGTTTFVNVTGAVALDLVPPPH